MTEIVNPYWDAVRHLVGPQPYGLPGPPCIDWIPNRYTRDKMAAAYTWTVPDPDAVAFVAEHSQDRVVDPMAGTGYWAYLLGQCGVDVVAYDMAPPGGPVSNPWHPNGPPHVPVAAGDARDAVAAHPDRTMLLSWPPGGEPIGGETVKAFEGDRIIYIGEPYSGGVCGDIDLFVTLAHEWDVVGDFSPIQYWGIHDRIVVFDRIMSR